MGRNRRMNLSDVLIMLMVALVVGVATSAQSRINAGLGVITGPIQATFISCLIGFIIITALLFFDSNHYSFKELVSIDKKLLLGGLMGPMIIMGYNYLIPKYGSTFSLSLVLVFQLITVLLLDHFGFLGTRLSVNLSKVVGVALVVVGTYLTKK